MAPPGMGTPSQPHPSNTPKANPGSAHPAGAGQPRWGNPGEHVAGQHLPAVPHSWRAGSRLFWGAAPPVCPLPLCSPPGQGGARCGLGQGSAAPLSGGRVQPDKESLLDSGSKQSISGKRWAGEIKAAIPPRLPPHRGVPCAPNRRAALPQPSPLHLQAEPKQAQPSKARFKPSSLLCRPQGCPDYSSTRDGKAGIISLAPLERFPFVSGGEEWRCCVFTA